MRLIGLYAYNFKKLRFAESLFFPEGIVLISGLNESGKSSILDAILYALFGKMIRPSVTPSDDEILAYGSNRATIRLEFAMDSRRFVVTREILRDRPNTATLNEVLTGGAQRPLARTQTAVTEEIVKLLGGITFDEIVASNVVAQKDLERLIKQDKGKREKIINVFLNLESFNKVLEALGEERTDIEGTKARPGRLSVEQERLTQYMREFEEFNSKKEQLSQKSQEAEDLSRRAEALRQESKETESLYQALQEYDDRQKEKEKLIIELQGKEELSQDIKKQLGDLISKEEELSATRKLLAGYGGLDEVDSPLSEVRNHLGALGKLDAEYESQETRTREIESEIQSRSGRLPKDSKIVSETAKLSELRQKRTSTKPLQVGVVVFFLLALLLASVSLAAAALPGILALVLLLLVARTQSQVSMLAELERKYQSYLSEAKTIESLEQTLSVTRSKLQTLKNQVLSSEARIFELCQKVVRYADVLSRHLSAGPRAVATAMIKQLEEDSEARNRLQVRSQDLTKDLSRKADVERKEQELAQEIARLKSSIGTIKFPEPPAGLQFSVEIMTETAERRDKLNSEITKIGTLLTKTQEEIQELQEYLQKHKEIEQIAEEQKRKVQELQNRLSMIKLAIEGIEKTSEAIRNRVKPNVEVYMGRILPTITSGRYKAVMIDDRYNIQVWDPDAGDYKVKEVFSGGTEDQMLLAMRLAFALALLPEVKGRHPEFLFLDEPLGSSDEVRRGGVLELLRTELSQNFRQIFLISHVGGLESEVQQIIRLEDGKIVEEID